MKISLLQLITFCNAASGFGFGPASFHRIHGSPKPIPRRCKYVSRQMILSSSCDVSEPEDANNNEHLQPDDANRSSDDHDISRRSLLHSVGLQFAGAVSSGPLLALLRRSTNPDKSEVPTKSYGYVNAANAMGLVQFPCKPGELFNTYHLMRAGESGLEAEGILSTNPLFLTNREDAGMAQVEEACNDMMSKGINPSVVKYSLAAKCIDTANIVSNTMMVGRNRLVPEFTFMDPRGAGVWNGKSLASTEAAIWAMDVDEAGGEGRGAKSRPPANDDGTANETLHDQVIRLRQLLSILETQYSGDDILLIFPDGTSPALLSCLIAGIPLNNVHALDFSPGEIRPSVDMHNSKQLLKEKMASTSYNEALSVGREELAKLRNEERLKLIEKEKPRELLVKAKQVEPAQSKKKEVQRSSRFADNYEATDLGPDVFSAGAIGTMGYMGYIAIAPHKQDDESEAVIGSKPAPVLAYSNSTGSSVFDQQVSASSSTALAAAGATATISIPATATNVVDADDTGLFNPNVFEDVPVLSKQDRIDAADRAMEEYLNRDDGGDDWLSSMAEIMNEE